MLPAAAAPPDVASVKLEDVRLVGSIARENVTVTGVERAVYVAPVAGLTPVTVGAPSVVKLHATGEPSGVPSAAMIPELSVAVYVVLAVSGAAGVRVAMCFTGSYDTVALSG